MKFNPVKWAFVGCLSFILGACGGASGGTGSPAPSTTSTAVTYTSTATAGELLDYTIDTSKLTYSYTITNSQFGLDGQGGSGTLVDNGDGTYSPTGMPKAKIFPVQNGMLVGEVKLTINGTDRVIPLIGFKNLVTALADIQGTYNYVERVCTSAAASRQCGSNYGTFHINADGTWTSCSKADYDISSTCSQHPRSSGTLNSLGGGKWQVMSASFEIGTGMVFKAPNGQKVWVIDLSRATAQGGAGIGILAGSSKNAVSSSDTNGTWIVGGTTGAVQYDGTLNVSGDSYTAAGVLLSGTGSIPVSGSATLSHNAPWNGFVETLGGGFALLAGTGMYAGVDPSLGSIEVGLRK